MYETLKMYALAMKRKGHSKESQEIGMQHLFKQILDEVYK